MTCPVCGDPITDRDARLLERVIRDRDVLGHRWLKLTNPHKACFWVAMTKGEGPAQRLRDKLDVLMARAEGAK